MKRRYLSLIGILAVVLVVSIGISNEAVAAGNGQGLASAFGLTHVDGQDVLVHVIALVNDNELPEQAAERALAAQGARQITSYEFTTLNMRWSQFDDTNPGNDFVTQNYNPSNEPSGASRAAFTNSQSTWNNIATSRFAFDGNVATHNRCPSLVQECGKGKRGKTKRDGLNDVAWLPLNDDGTLGVTWIALGSNPEADMAMNTNFSWSDDGINDIDVETVFLHENGHVLGLGHSDVSSAVMYFQYHGVQRSPAADDIDGITSLYPSGVEPPAGPPDVTITSPVNGAGFASGSAITVNATAIDDSDADVSGTITWQLDGNAIGSPGSSIEISPADGSHTITASATDINGTGSDSILITVGAAQLNVVVTMSDYTLRSRDRATFTIAVNDGSSAVESASIQLTVNAPKSTLSCSATTNSSGIATCSYKTNAGRDGRGTYSAAATASKSGFASGTSPTITYTVN